MHPVLNILSVAQLVEQMTLNHRVEGSSPSGETKKGGMRKGDKEKKKSIRKLANCHLPTWNEGHSSLNSNNRGVAQLASALRSGRRGREFESRHPDFHQPL